MFDNEDLIWNIIGKKKFCCFKYNLQLNQSFCKNKFNLTGFCSRQSCPLANNTYATIIEKDGILFLYFKTVLNSKFPSKTWKKISLSRNFIKAVQQIDLHLALWPKFFINKIKLRLTKLNQILIRARIKNIEIKDLNFNLDVINNKKEFKLTQKIKIEKMIEQELLNRLHMGVYGDNYNLKPIYYWKKINIENRVKFKNSLQMKTILI
jgi:protein MAK16